MRPRSANEWRDFWRHGGEEALERKLREIWPPLHAASDEVCAAQAPRVALLLGSAAPVRALAAELGRIRRELELEQDSEADDVAAEHVIGWFQAQTVA